MNDLETSLPLFPSEQVKTIFPDIEKLLQGPPPGEKWHSPIECNKLLRQLGKLRTQLREREKVLLYVILDGEGESQKEELAVNMLTQQQAWKRYLELVFGGKINWDTVESLPPLNYQQKNCFDRFFKDGCIDPRHTLSEWLGKGPLLGRFKGEAWLHCPEVLLLIKMIGISDLNSATVAACYYHLFYQFPHYPNIEPDKSLTEEENSLRALAVKPAYAIWELQQIADALGIGGKKTLAN